MTCNTLDDSGLQNGLFYIAKRGISRHRTARFQMQYRPYGRHEHNIRKRS